MVPSFCFLRCLILVVVSWCLLACLTICCTLLPVFLGRLAHHYTQLVPSSLAHDPACYVIGLLVLSPLLEAVTQMSNRVVVNAAHRMQQQELQQQQQQQQQQQPANENLQGPLQGQGPQHRQQNLVVVLPQPPSLWHIILSTVNLFSQIPIKVQLNGN